jgi:ribosome biogenesis SPOUT family RNA methylase Rps3
MSCAHEKRQALEAELNRLVAAIADGGHSAFLLKAVEQRKQELQNIGEHLQALSADPHRVQQADIITFVVGRLAMLRDLIQSDVSQARAQILKHVNEIRLIPKQTDEGTEYVAVGEWNLLGDYPEMDRARHLPGVRARLVAGVGFEPTTFGL